MHSSDPVCFLQALTRAPNDPGLSSVNPALSVPSHLCMDTATQPPPATQGYSNTSQFSYEYRQPIAQPLPSVHNHSLPAPMPQNPVQPEQNARRTRRSTRAHDPVRGQRTARQREGGRGRTRGAPNYKPRELKSFLISSRKSSQLPPRGGGLSVPSSVTGQSSRSTRQGLITRWS
jgi:hypothetical protein